MIIASPAAGYVQEIVPRTPCDLIGHDGIFLLVSIFLPPWGDHNQYAPVCGSITEKHYQRGTFHFAGLFHKSKNNERQYLVLDTPVGEFVVVQLAGMMARHITSSVKVGDKVQQFQKIGHIALGSRVDIYMPPNTVLHYRKYDFIAAKAPLAEVK